MKDTSPYLYFVLWILLILAILYVVMYLPSSWLWSRSIGQLLWSGQTIWYTGTLSSGSTWPATAQLSDDSSTKQKIVVLEGNPSVNVDTMEAAQYKNLPQGSLKTDLP